jgi:putative N-acetylmannosamine-6-phosphate epimerase
MMASRGMGDINPSKIPKGKRTARRDDTDFTQYKEGGKTKSKVNAAGNYTKPGLRKRIFNSVKAAAIVGTGAGQWSARKAQVMAKRYKAAGGGYRD